MLSVAKEKQEGDKTPSIDKLVDYIHLKESTYGKQNYSKCKAIGKFNEYGLGIPGNGRYICFDTREDNKKAVEEWIKKRLSEGLDERTLLCYYNSGVKTNNCNYIKNYE